MDKPMGYWGVDTNHPLIKDIAETWGDYLQNLTPGDAFWLVGRIGHEVWCDTDTNDQPPSDEVDEVVQRIYELPYDQRIALLKAIINS